MISQNIYTIFISLILLTSNTYLFAQKPTKGYPKIIYKKADFEDKIDSLRKLCGYRKKIPPEFELQTLIAISHYPDLHKAKIKFKYSKRAKLPIAARPSFVDFIHTRKNRQYKIVMRVGSDYVLRRSFNAQVGLIGHELAHIQFYRYKSSLSLIGIGFKYAFSRKYAWKFELDTDKRAIDFGFGWQLLEAPIYFYKEQVKKYMLEKGYIEL